MVSRKKKTDQAQSGKSKRAAALGDAASSPAQAGKRGRKPPPPGETKRDKFVRLCEHRMNKAVRAIELLGNLTAPHYAWTPEDEERMHSALMDAIERTFARFEARAPRDEDASKFKLQ